MDKFGELIATNAVRFRRLLPGPIERVWEHIVNGDKRGLWLCSGKTEPMVGGSIEMIFRNYNLTDAPDVAPPDKHKDMPKEVSFEGKVTACEPPHLFRHTWEFGDEYSELTYELAEHGEKVMLTLTQTRLGTREMKVDVCGGWHTHLDILDNILAGREPGPFWKKIIEMEAEYERRIPA